MAGLAFPRARTALLLLDTINLFGFPGGKTFAREWLRSARRIAALRERARQVPWMAERMSDEGDRKRLLHLAEDMEEQADGIERESAANDGR